MKFNLKPTIPVFVGAVLAFTSAQGSSPDRIGAYDFSYSSFGDQRVRPAQVFDDGRSTFFQFRAGEAVPAILAVTNQGPTLLVPSAEGPYVRVPSVASGYVLRMGYSVGQVAYTGHGRAQVALPAPVAPAAVASAPQAVALGRLLATASAIQGLPAEMTQPAPRIALDVNSYATPLKGDRAQWTTPVETSQDFSVPFFKGSAKLGPTGIKTVRALAASMSRAQKIEITGRDDDTYREGLAEARAAAVADVLAATGIDRSRIQIKTTAVLKTGPNKSTVVGASIVSQTTRAYVPESQQQPHPSAGSAVAARANADSALDQVIARLRAGQITPAQAAQALEAARTAPAATHAGGGHMAPKRAMPSRWLVRAADGSVENMLKRWASDSGWTVVNKGAPQIAINGDAEVQRPDFLQAADYAITQAKQSGYRIKATAYSNNVLVLTEEVAK